MAAFYADYIADLREVVAELDQHPDRFQTFSLHIELAAAGSIVVYETKRQKGQLDCVYYGRPAGAERNQKLPQAAAFTAVHRFFALGQFLALKTDGRSGPAGSGELTLHADYPHCAVNFSYRRKGQPSKRSMLMVFIGFNDDVDADRYVSTIDDASFLVPQRPFVSDTAFEWK